MPADVAMPLPPMAAGRGARVPFGMGKAGGASDVGVAFVPTGRRRRDAGVVLATAAGRDGDI